MRRGGGGVGGGPPLAPMERLWAGSTTLSRPSKDLGLAVASPVTKVCSKSWRTALALSSTTAASRSWRLERVAMRKLSMSASPPMILRVTVCWVKVGVDSVQGSPTWKKGAEGGGGARVWGGA